MKDMAKQAKEWRVRGEAKPKEEGVTSPNQRYYDGNRRIDECLVLAGNFASEPV